MPADRLFPHLRATYFNLHRETNLRFGWIHHPFIPTFEFSPLFQVFLAWMIKYSSTATPECHQWSSSTPSTPASLWLTRTASGQRLPHSVKMLNRSYYRLMSVFVLAFGTGTRARDWTTSTTETLVILASHPWSTWTDTTAHCCSPQQVSNTHTRTKVWVQMHKCIQVANVHAHWQQQKSQRGSFVAATSLKHLAVTHRALMCSHHHSSKEESNYPPWLYLHHPQEPEKTTRH